MVNIKEVKFNKGLFKNDGKVFRPIRWNLTNNIGYGTNNVSFAKFKFYHVMNSKAVPLRNLNYTNQLKRGKNGKMVQASKLVTGYTHRNGLKGNFKNGNIVLIIKNVGSRNNANKAANNYLKAPKTPNNINKNANNNKYRKLLGNTHASKAFTAINRLPMAVRRGLLTPLR
jgi:hypothetical protein